MFFLRTKEKIEVVGSERLPQDHPESKGRKKLELNPAVSPSRAKPFWQHLNSAPRSGGVALFESGVGRDPWILKAQSGGGFTGREVVWCLNAHSQKKKKKKTCYKWKMPWKAGSFPWLVGSVYMHSPSVGCLSLEWSPPGPWLYVSGSEPLATTLVSEVQLGAKAQGKKLV